MGTELGARDVDREDWSCRQLPFLAMAALWVAAIYAVSRDWALEQLVFVGIGMLLLGVPMCLAGICSGTLLQQRKISAMFRRHGWLSRLWLGRWVRILMWTIWGLGMSAVLLLQFHVYDHVGWAVLVLIVPLFSVAFTTIYRRLSGAGMHEDVAVIQALAWSRWICPVLVLLLYIVAMTWLGDPPQYSTINDAVAAKTDATNEWAGNALVGEALRGLAYFHGLEAFVLGNLHAMEVPSEWWLIALFGMGTGHLTLLYNACLGLSCFRIPRAAFKRTGLEPRSATGKFTVALVATFLPLFIFLPLLAQLEPWAKTIADQREGAEKRTTDIVESLLVERISGDGNCNAGDDHNDARPDCLYRQGTFEEITNARTRAASSVRVAADQLRRELAATFARLENEAVDEYLDWYYSLTGEYGRLFTLLTGGTAGLEEHLAEKAREAFGRDEWFTGFHSAIERLFATDGEASTEYARAVREILDRNRVDPQDDSAEVVLTVSLDDVFQPSFYQDFVPAAHRFGLAGVGGSAAGAGVARIVAHKVTAKMLGKSLIKLAAKAPAKALASKIGAGALAGGAVGTIVPIAGTAVGAVAGIIVGIGGGVAIDGLLLEAEEAWSRDEFRREIVEAIRETQREFEDQYLGTPSSSSAQTP